MLTFRLQTRFIALLPALALAACAAGPKPATVIRTVFDPDQARYANILVISVTGDYATRASFERQVARLLADRGATAAAYYTVIGRNPQLTRSFLEDAIRSREYDGVLFTRVKGQEQEELAPMRPVGAAFNLFEYDYPELNRDIGIRQAGSYNFVTEFYSALGRRKVWAIETLSTDKGSIDEVITEQAFTIANQLRVDGLIR